MTDNKNHYFLIGLSPFTISEILTITAKNNPIVDLCANFKAALDKTQNNYDVYIIHIQNIEQDLVQFLTQLQKKTEKKYVLALIDHNLSEERIQILRKYRVIDDFLLEPIQKKQLENLLEEKLGPEKKTPELKTATTSDRLLALKLKYDQSVGEKIELLKNLVAKAKLNKENINDLRMEVHKIAGTAGSFGYQSVTEKCKELERQINRWLSQDVYPEKDIVKSLDEFLEAVQKGFYAPEESLEILNPLKVFTNKKPFLYLVDDDVHFLKLIERIKEDFSFTIQVEFDAEKAKIELADPAFNPTFLIVAQKFRGTAIKGVDLIKEEQKRDKINPTTFYGLLIQDDSIDTRMSAVEQGIHYIFKKPISVTSLLNSIACVLESKAVHSAKILILDDDKDFCDFIHLLLEEINIPSLAIHDSESLFKALDEFKPNILLLDILLPKYSGLDLLKTLRGDSKYRNLIIVAVTSSDHLIDISTKAYSANVDDILFKPIDKQVLQKRILNLINRRVTTKSEIVDNSTGFYTEKKLFSDLQNHLKNTDLALSYFILFELQNLSSWLKEHNSVSFNELQIAISNQLVWMSDYNMKCYLYESSKFALIIDANNIDQIKTKMIHILSELIAKEPSWHLSFNCCLVPILKNYEHVSQILREAKDALHEAEKQPSNSIKIVEHLPQGEVIEKKEVMIIDSDIGLLKILKNSFEAHGVTVKTYSEGYVALRDLLNLPESKLPALIILERKLIDMDGMDLFIKLKSRFRTEIPCFMLTVYSSDKDVSDAIRQGVLEYMFKPFNISILIQKALRVINHI